MFKYIIIIQVSYVVNFTLINCFMPVLLYLCDVSFHFSSGNWWYNNVYFYNKSIQPLIIYLHNIA